MHTEKTNKKKTSNGLKYLLLGLVLILGVYAYKKTKDYGRLENLFKQEQAELKDELDELIDDYKDLSVKKKILSKRLIKEMNKIVVLRDSVKNLKAENYNLISKFKRRIATLERENRYLFAQVDSLKLVNKSLENENYITAQKLTAVDSTAEELKRKNQELLNTEKILAAKVAEAGIIKSSTITAIAMKERASGKLTSTTRSRRTDAFKVKFKLLENKFTVPGEKKVYVQILDQHKNVVAAKGTLQFNKNKSLVFSDELTINYQNKEIDILSLILVNRADIKGGVYKINVFIDDKYTTSTALALK